MKRAQGTPYIITVTVDTSTLGVPYYPTNDFGPLMKGLVIGGLGIFHVFLAQFAIGGGVLMTYFEWLSGKGKLPSARRFTNGYFKVLVLVSFVVGALTGVGMWFTSIQTSPRTIGLMVDTFHWVWATEWTFFALEVIAGYCFYRYGERLDGRSRLFLLGLYTTAAWFSLFWINGILSWQLTPGAWLESGDLWAGFFNPTFWPSLFFRTFAAMAIAALVAALVISLSPFERDEQKELLHRAAHLLAPMALMPLLGAWYLLAMPKDSRSWVLGGSPAMSMFFGLGAGASLLVGLYALFGLLLRRLYINSATASLLIVLGFAATAGGEFVREGARKPFTVRETLYSNAMTPAEIVTMREKGSVTNDPYPLRDAADFPNDQVRLGAKVYRFQCSVCHTVGGVNGLVHLAGTWTGEQTRLNVAKLQHTKPFMPPFAGTPEELEALVRYIEWEAASRPKEFEVTSDPAELAQIKRWLDEAGTAPGYTTASEKKR